MDYTQIVTVLVSGLANLGGVMVLVRKYTSQVDDHNKAIPALTESLRAINETLKVTTDSLKELYASRNEHDIEIARIITTHRIKGCDLPRKEPRP